jgi:hypothetical protein
MFNSNPSLADIAAVTGNREGGFGGDGWWVLIILFALFGGFGGRGFGCADAAQCATQADLQRGFDTQGINGKLNGLENAFASLGYDQLAQMNGINSTIMQTGFGLQSSIDGGFNGLSRQIADCCCENRSAIAQVRYDMAAQNCELGHRIDGIGDRIVGELTAIRLEQKNERIAELTSQLQAANLAASQVAQNQYLIQQLKPCPNPAYVVPNPNGCYNGCM